MARSTFTPLGLPIGENNMNMTYLYGLSDFFAVMFEDTGKLNLLLESGAEKASEIYSKFLQLTSTISLEDIQKTSGETLKLVTIKTSDAVPGETNVYNLSVDLVSSRYVANRPLLPTTLFEQNVDYRLERTSTGQVRIRFAKDISEAGFSTRLLSDEVTKEYAMWFVDAEIDEKWISTYFGNLIGLSPQSSTDSFKNYVYGLYYVYANGPTIDLLRKGLNLTLGIPLSRGVETVLEIRKYLETDQYIVITDENQYIIPYGLPPAVEEGQVLGLSDEIAKWIEVKDYINDGAWWIDLQIPDTIIPYVPPGQVDRHAVAGSQFDYLMRTYLKKHTFLVNVNVTFFKDNQVFNDLAEVIRRAKPAYTQAVYIWTVDKDELLTLNDDVIQQRRDMFRCDNLSNPIDKFFRSNTNGQLKRGCPQFIRYNINHATSKLLGIDPYTNGTPSNTREGIVTGYVNSVSRFRDNTTTETAWLNTLHNRGAEIARSSRSKITFNRSIHTDLVTNPFAAGTIVRKTMTMAGIPETMRIVPLYITTQADIKTKCENIGIFVPGMQEWTFDLLNPAKVSAAINSMAINEGIPDTAYFNVKTHYNTLFNRGENTHYLSVAIPKVGYTTWKPPIEDISRQDYITGIRIFDNIVGIYWVTNSQADYSAMGIPVYETEDSLRMTWTSKPQRGFGHLGSSFYISRGRGVLNYVNNGEAVNDDVIDGNDIIYSTITNTYSDTENTPRVMNRSGVQLTHLMEIK
jgi:hypothetical protein